MSSAGPAHGIAGSSWTAHSPHAAIASCNRYKGYDQGLSHYCSDRARVVCLYGYSQPLRGLCGRCFVADCARPIARRNTAARCRLRCAPRTVRAPGGVACQAACCAQKVPGSRPITFCRRAHFPERWYTRTDSISASRKAITLRNSCDPHRRFWPSMRINAGAAVKRPWRSRAMDGGHRRTTVAKHRSGAHTDG